MRRATWAVVAAVAAAGLLGAGCGTPDANFPAETVCPSPQAVPTSRATPGAMSPQAFVARVRGGAAELERLREGFAESYPGETFYRREAFRPDFAAYADATICLARELLALTAPTPRLEVWKGNVDAALRALVEHTVAGREAVRSRNVTEYRAWHRGVEERLGAVMAAAEASP